MSDRPHRANHRRRAWIVLAATVAAVGALGAVTLIHPAASTAEEPQVELWVYPAGGGVVTTDPPALTLDHGSTAEKETECARGGPDEQGCHWRYPPGTTVTLRAEAPDNDHAFVGWGRWECPGRGDCTLTLDRPTSVVATFNGLEVEVIPQADTSDGVITSVPAGISCRPGDTPDDNPGCRHPFTPGEDVVLTADPAAGVTWGDGCEPADDDAKSPSCIVTPARTRTLVSVGLGGMIPESDPPAPMFATLEVARRGDGSGSVHGKFIDCRSGCSQSYRYGATEHLVAQADPGSAFAGWEGTCRGGTAGVDCQISVGPVTSVRARFETIATPATTSTHDVSVPPTGEAPAPAPAPKTAPRLTARLAGVWFSHGRPLRRMRVGVVSSAAGEARLRLYRGAYTSVSRLYRVRPGRNLLGLTLPRIRGAMRLVLTIRGDDGSVTRVERPVRLGAQGR